MDKKEFFDFFIEKGLKSPILNSKGIEKYNADLHSQVIEFKNSFYPNSDRKFSEILYCYLKEIESNPVCKNCCKEPTKFKMFSFGYFDYCSVKCSSNSIDKKESIKKTCIEKYGVENVSMYNQVRECVKKTTKIRYGTENYFYSSDFKEKYKKTCIEKYGVEHYFASEECKKKLEKTWIEIYGSLENKNKVLGEKSLEGMKKSLNFFKWSQEELKNLRNYRNSVRYHTKKTYEKYKEVINPDNLKRGHKNYHLDHIYPIIEGWKKKIPAIDIANYKNLTLLFHEDNRNKSSKTSMTVEEFYKLIK